MTSPREPLHQPPNPEDLQRVPPTGPDCAKVRGWLRDFVDHDLDDALAAELEEHVHRCRVCAVELARAEHEVLCVRRLFVREAAPTAVLPPDFAARVVERLVLDETSLLGKESLAGAVAAAAAPATPAAHGGSAVGGTPADGPAAPPGGGGHGAGFRPATMFVGALLALVAFALSVELFDGLGGPKVVARLLVLSAKGAFGAGPLGPGSGLGESESLRIDRGGEATLEWHDPSTKTQPAAKLLVHGDGEVRFQDGAPMLLDGRIDVQTHRPVSIRMADGSRIDLEVGDYEISADAGRRPGDETLAAMPTDALVEIEVKTGEATVLRSGFGPAAVGVGQMGIYQGKSQIRIVSSGSGPVASGSEEQRQPAEPAPTPSAFLIGYVREFAGVPSVGATVGLAMGLGGLSQQVACLTAGDGSFHLELGSSIDTPFVIASALAPRWRNDLGIAAPDAVPLQVQGGNSFLARHVQLANSAPCHGQVRDDLGVPRPGVQVVPCIVDELFGTVLPLDSESTGTDGYGVFRCDRLPARLPPHQSLVLLLVHDELEPATVAIPTRGSPLAQLTLPPVSLRRLQTVRLHMLPLAAAVEILEELPGLPSGAGIRRRVVMTDVAGVVPSIALGRGKLWVRYVGEPGPTLRLLVLDAPGELPQYRPMPQSNVLQASVFRPLQPIAGTGMELVRSWRHQSFVLGEPPVGESILSVQTVDNLGRPVVAQVFGVQSSGVQGATDVRFLGFTSPTGRIQAGDGSVGTGVFAIAPDGSCGMFHHDGQSGIAVIELVEPGRALLHPSLRPGPGAPLLTELRFERLDTTLPGMKPMALRLVGPATGWEAGDLVPGVYRVSVGNSSVTVVVPAGGFGVIQ